MHGWSSGRECTRRVPKSATYEKSQHNRSSRSKAASGCYSQSIIPHETWSDFSAASEETIIAQAKNVHYFDYMKITEEHVSPIIRDYGLVAGEQRTRVFSEYHKASRKKHNEKT